MISLTCSSRAIQQSRNAVNHLLSQSSHLSDQQVIMRRCLVTLSIPPPIDTPMERPETLVLIESSLYKQKWEQSFAKYYPERGMHFGSLDITSADNCSVHDMTLASMEQTLSNDTSALSEPAYTILIARGPLQSLIAQYYLESLPLAGLVMIDPLILPDDGRSGVHVVERLKESIHGLSTTINDTTKSEWSPFKKLQPDDLVVASNNISMSSELNVLHALPQMTSRPLYLEPSSVPIIIFHSRCDKHQDFYENCANSSAEFHGVDESHIFCIPINSTGAEDVSWVMDRVYNWYEDSVY